MKALVTGGAGFIGSHIVEELIEKKWEVKVLDNLSAGKEDNLAKCRKVINLIKGSITDRELLGKVLKDIDIVFHEAAQTSVVHSINNPAYTWEINITGTKLLLNAAVSAGVKRVIFASSAAVYGNALPPLRESKTTKPISPYGNSKRMGELLMQEYYEKEGVETASLRYFNVYGPRQNAASEYSGVISKFINKMLNDERPVIYGNGLQTRDFVFVKDVVRANICAAKARKTRGEVYNIGTGRENSVLDLVRTLNKILGKELEVVFEKERAGDIMESFADLSLAKEKLGFVAETTLRNGLEETVRWYKNNTNQILPG
jgi:UDP-glucose 4-epimerase